MTAPGEPEPTAAAPRRPWNGLAGAVRALTVFPVPRATAGPLSESVAYFPLVGVACGALAGAVRLGGDALLGRLPGSVLALIALVALTGARPQVGLAGCAEGLGVRGDRDRRLAAMRDSAMGALGVIALVGWALLLVAALAPLNGIHGLMALIAAGGLSRLTILLQAVTIDAARPDGPDAALAVPASALTVAAATAAVAALAAGPWRGLLAVGVGCAVELLASLFASRSVGGRTGDTLGATVAVTEVAVCLALLGSWR